MLVLLGVQRFPMIAFAETPEAVPQLTASGFDSGGFRAQKEP